MTSAVWPRDDRRLAIASASPRSRSAVTCKAKPLPAGSADAAAESVAAGCFAATVETGAGGAATPAEPDFSDATGSLRAGLSVDVAAGAELGETLEPAFKSSVGCPFLSRRSK